MFLVSTMFWVSGRRRSPAGLGRPGPGSHRPPPCSCAAPSPPPPPPPAPAQSCCCPAAACNRCQVSSVHIVITFVYISEIFLYHEATATKINSPLVKAYN